MGGKDDRKPSRGFPVDNRKIDELEVVYSGWILKKKRKKIRKETYSSYIYKGVLSFMRSIDAEY